MQSTQDYTDPNQKRALIMDNSLPDSQGTGWGLVAYSSGSPPCSVQSSAPSSPPIEQSKMGPDVNGLSDYYRYWGSPGVGRCYESPDGDSCTGGRQGGWIQSNLPGGQCPKKYKISGGSFRGGYCHVNVTFQAVQKPAGVWPEG